MSTALSYFWSIGASFFNLLGSMSFVGISLLCILLGVWVMSILIRNIIPLLKGINGASSRLSRKD